MKKDIIKEVPFRLFTFPNCLSTSMQPKEYNLLPVTGSITFRKRLLAMDSTLDADVIHRKNEFLRQILLERLMKGTIVYIYFVFICME